MKGILIILVIAASFITLFATYFIYKKIVFKKLNKQIFFIQPYLSLGFLILFLFTVIFSSIYYSKFFLPEPASVHGKQTLPLYNFTLIITGIAFFITQILLFFFVYRYRFNGNSKALYFKENIRLEFLWTIIPFITFIVLFVWGQIIWARMTSKPEGKVVEIEIMGQQFNWWARYPGIDNKFGRFNFTLTGNNNDMGIDYSDPNSLDDIIPVQIHIPKNTNIRLRLRSRDVIHSVFIPHLRVKMDAVPGMATYIHFTPDISTQEMRAKLNDPQFNYEVTCAELCGRMHFAMKLIVVVDEQSDFDKWYNSQRSWVAIHPDLIK